MSVVKKWVFISLQYLLPQKLLSRFMGWLADAELGWFSRLWIRIFVRLYKVNMAEAAEPSIESYASFNEFFTRPLRDGVRPICLDKSRLISPVDGAVSQIGQIHEQSIFQAKGKRYSLTQLFGGNRKMADLFRNGSFATIYLAPYDYHRIHMPIDGQLIEMVHVPGSLFSVSPTTVNGIDGVFARNERLLCLFDTECGPMVMVLVGAMIVGSIETVWAGSVVPPKKHMIQRWQYGQRSDLPQRLLSLSQGEEMGRFKLGSTVILCFAKDRVAWDSELVSECKVCLGDQIAQIL